MVVPVNNKSKGNTKAFALVAVGALVVMALAALAFTRGASTPPSSPHVVYDARVQLIGIACGSHLAVDPPYIAAMPGSRLRIVNDSPWPHQLHLSTKDAAATAPKDILASSALAPGDTWLVDIPSQPGDYFIVSDNAWYHLAGLRGEVQVR